MVNPILATIIKKAIKGGLKSQTGGADIRESNVMTFFISINNCHYWLNSS